MPYMEGAGDAQIVAYAKNAIDGVNKALGKSWSLADDKLLLHYKHRRWLPLVFSIEEGLNVEITPDMEEKLKSLLGPSLVLQPSYLRHYPQGATACHIIGYTGKTRPLPTGPIVDGDPVFEEMEGRESDRATMQLAIARHHEIERGIGQVRGFLRDTGDARLARQIQVALVGFDIAQQRGEQGRLAGAVAADHAHAIPGVQSQVHIGQQQAFATPEGEIAEGNHPAIVNGAASLPPL